MSLMSHDLVQLSLLHTTSWYMISRLLLQALRTETQALDSQLQQANAANHVFTDKLSSMATELAAAKHAQLESASQLQAMQVTALPTSLVAMYM